MRLITETKDPYFVKAILNHGDTWDSFTFDGAIPLNQWLPDVSSNIWLIMYDGDNVAGLFRGERLGNKMLSVHVVIFPEYRGVGSAEWGLLAKDHVTKYYGITSLLAITPSEKAKLFAEASGFTYVKTIKNSLQKNGEMLDQYLLECEI